MSFNVGDNVVIEKYRGPGPNTKHDRGKVKTTTATEVFLEDGSGPYSQATGWHKTAKKPEMKIVINPYRNAK